MKTLLLIEDDEINRQFLLEILQEDYGCKWAAWTGYIRERGSKHIGDFIRHSDAGHEWFLVFETR